MSKSLRLSEKWFRRGLWLVALVFASFLIGLGSTVVSDLPQVERVRGIDDFIDKPRAEPLRATIKASEAAELEAARELDQIQLQLNAAQQASRNARETFANWLSTRRATALPDQDTELIARTKALDAFKQKEEELQRKVNAQQKITLDARQGEQRARMALSELERDAQIKLDAEYRRVELRVFAYRLALTLPLLVVAGWLFVKKRKSTYWPFVWGFIFFALFAFFRRAGALPAELRRLRALRGGHPAHGAGGALRHRRAQPVPRAAEAGRAAARPGAPRGTELRHRARAPGQERVPGLRAAGGPEEQRDRLLPALRHRPFRPLRQLRNPQERVLEVLPRVRHLGRAARAAASGDGHGRGVVCEFGHGRRKLRHVV